MYLCTTSLVVIDSVPPNCDFVFVLCKLQCHVTSLFSFFFFFFCIQVHVPSNDILTDVLFRCYVLGTWVQEAVIVKATSVIF